MNKQNKASLPHPRDLIQHLESIHFKEESKESSGHDIPSDQATLASSDQDHSYKNVGKNKFVMSKEITKRIWFEK